ncbi:unnamed protein product [Chrysodeixis includens]|uniref:Uncharacterized protein n=1 Tax=Chrysodeixis includens TaxID=689277 RepID=A0A9N8KZC1_CHRIL|nr:unnamed protein product [Chrysodeixis includens]
MKTGRCHDLAPAAPPNAHCTKYNVRWEPQRVALLNMAATATRKTTQHLKQEARNFLATQGTRTEDLQDSTPGKRPHSEKTKKNRLRFIRVPLPTQRQRH